MNFGLHVQGMWRAAKELGILPAAMTRLARLSNAICGLLIRAPMECTTELRTLAPGFFFVGGMLAGSKRSATW